MEMMREDKVWISFEIDKETWIKLHKHATKVTLSVEQVIKELINQTINKETKK